MEEAKYATFANPDGETAKTEAGKSAARNLAQVLPSKLLRTCGRRTYSQCTVLNALSTELHKESRIAHIAFVRQYVTKNVTHG